MDDRFLIEQSAEGNKNAFRLLLVRYQRMVFSFLGTFLFPIQVLEDLAQETFLRAYRNIADFDAEKGASFSTWLVTIARNLAINEKAKKRRRREHPGSVMDMNQDFSEENPQDMLEKRSLRSRVRNAINQLPEKFHTAVVLSYFDELSLEEIAQIKECPLGTVKSRVFRGKQILRQILEKENVL
ncbi:MAG: sigma-70 family RNA polymerase sigma factor [Candidatus Aminicenantes bacterium]|nr:sigma-70 family RNA polymerase sigma factor [Candidatus Aminicenantes bacterium]